MDSPVTTTILVATLIVSAFALHRKLRVPTTFTSTFGSSTNTKSKINSDRTESSSSGQDQERTSAYFHAQAQVSDAFFFLIWLVIGDHISTPHLDDANAQNTNINLELNYRRIVLSAHTLLCFIL
jgi:hypothetical protein